MYLQRGAVLTEANLLRLPSNAGDVLLATAPGELLPKLGLALNAQLCAAPGAVPVETAAIIGLVNDELAYILPDEDFVFPAAPFASGDHYDESMSIGSEAGPNLMAALAALLA